MLTIGHDDGNSLMMASRVGIMMVLTPHDGRHDGKGMGMYVIGVWAMLEVNAMWRCMMK